MASCALAACRLGFEELETAPGAGAGIAGMSTGGLTDGAGAPAEQAGTGGSVAAAGSAAGGDPSTGEAGASGAGGGSGSGGLGGTGGTGGTGGCVSSGAEVCDGLDNDCSGTADDAGVCPATCEGHVFNGHDYVFCRSAADQPTAQANCQALNMSLVRIDDADEKDWLRGICFAAVVGNSSTLWPWLGASDDAVAGEWRWADGTQFWQGSQTGGPVAGLYNNWGGGQPVAKDSCATMQNNTTDSLWSTQPCNSPHPYTCESP